MQQAALREGRSQIQFNKDKEIIPYIEQFWEAMTTMPRRLTQSWYSTVQRSLVKDINTLFVYEEHGDQGAMYGLFHQDLRLIKPNYEIMSKTGALRLTEDGYIQGEICKFYFSMYFNLLIYFFHLRNFIFLFVALFHKI